jgi:xanthine dehydrogenase large subunit
MERAMLHTDNAYFIPDIRITGTVCKINLPSNTAFRGFGGPQGVANIENIIETIAQHLGKDALEIRRRNTYGIDDRNITPYGQVVRNNMLPRVFEQLSSTSSYEARREEIAKFNKTSRTHLRGLSMTAVKFGISFTKKSMNQANALVNIYTDGSVMVSTGGTEMGQGVNTRVRQIVADELGVPYDAVIVAPTSTDKNHNTSPTAASASTDLNGAACVDACSRLKQRLREFVATQIFHSSDSIQFADGFIFNSNHRVSFKEAVQKAYVERVNLGERGFYATPGVDFDRETGQGTPFLYFTNGAAVAEVLIDRFTGEMKVERVDLLMDAGIPINPGIDRGQIVGGFIQGMGWVTTEELRYADSGELLTHSPTTYKIPNIGDVPRVFNIDLLNNPDNDVSLYRSKAVGEPPLLLGICVFMAAKNALSYLNPKAANLLTIPATGEKLLMAITQAQALSTRRSERDSTPSAAQPAIQPRT